MFDQVLINLKIIIQHYIQAKDYILAISNLGAIWTLKHAKANPVNMALAISLLIIWSWTEIYVKADKK
jgi:hypothetical protein